MPVFPVEAGDSGSESYNIHTIRFVHICLNILYDLPKSLLESRPNSLSKPVNIVGKKITYSNHRSSNQAIVYIPLTFPILSKDRTKRPLSIIKMEVLLTKPAPWHVSLYFHTRHSPLNPPPPHHDLL